MLCLVPCNVILGSSICIDMRVLKGVAWHLVHDNPSIILAQQGLLSILAVSNSSATSDLKGCGGDFSQAGGRLVTAFEVLLVRRSLKRLPARSAAAYRR